MQQEKNLMTVTAKQPYDSKYMRDLLDLCGGENFHGRQGATTLIINADENMMERIKLLDWVESVKVAPAE